MTMLIIKYWTLAKRRVGRREHRARFGAIAILDIDHRGIDALAGNTFQRHGPAAGTAVPVTYLEQITPHMVVSDFLTAILAAPDRNWHRLRDRTDPYSATRFSGSFAGSTDRNG